MEKRRNLERGGIGTGQDKKKKAGALTCSFRTPRTWEKKEGQSATGQYMGKVREYRHSPMECLGQCRTGNGGSDGSEGETRAIRTPGESKQVTHLPA